jgi:hypothetical protein
MLAQGTFAGETPSGWQDLQFAGPVPITANTTYVASYLAPQGNYAADGNGLATQVDNTPLHALASSASGGNGVYGYGLDPAFPSQSYNATNYWVDVDFSTTTPSVPSQPQSTPRAGTRGNGPVLVITDPTNAFTDDVCAAILQTEGLPECAATDAANITSASQLTGYRVVIWADGAPPTSTQVSTITSWVTGGGYFVALKPSDVLDGLLGIGPKVANAILPDAYYRVDTTQAPGTGIESQVMQYHGIADEHPLAGARAAATLYSNSTTATSYPALTVNQVGAGTASAYLFDPSRSILQTRNGNPGFSGQVTTGPASNQPRLSDRFGAGYVDATKAAIPQADELEHLLTNQVEQATSLPRLWYLPTYAPSTHPGGLVTAAIVLTGDDHNSGSSQTLNRFAAEQAASPTGCSVADWTCYTSTSYAYPGGFSDSAVKPYTDQGFELSFHASNGPNCLDWTSTAQLSSLTNTVVQAWQTAFPTVNAAHPPLTERYHCYGIQRNYSGIAAEEASLGIAADTNTSCFPQNAFNVPQCLLSGTALPMPYVTANGTLTGVYQLTTQATDENPTTVSATAIQGLIQNATGSSSYYGYYTILAHLDNGGDSNQVAATALSTAQSAGIPMVSAAQATQFIQGRAATGISNVTYTANTETFSVANPVHGLEMLIPVAYGTKTLTTITCNGSSLPITQVTINGMAYAAVPSAGAGSYVGTYN